MSRLSKDSRIWLVKAFARNRGDIWQIQREWRIQFQTRAPDKKTIKNTAARFDEQGDVKDKPRTGRPKTARTPQNINNIFQEIRMNGRQSVNDIGLRVGVSKSSTHRILKNDLVLKAYHPTEVQGL